MLETTHTVASEKRLDYIDRNLNQKRSINLKTCADVYGHWRAYKRSYKKAPKDGVEFQIDYIDTGLALDEETRARAPIALALHGAPGSYHDFALLIHHLSQQKVRVIAPNFPEYVATVKTKVLFRHSADEKAAYLRDFLQAIQVNKIDLLVSHSSAIFPTLLILLNANNETIARQKLQEQLNAGAQQQQRQQMLCAKQAANATATKTITMSTRCDKESVQDEAQQLPTQSPQQQIRGSATGARLNESHNVQNGHVDVETGNEDEDTFVDANEELQHLDGNNNNEKVLKITSTGVARDSRQDQVDDRTTNELKQIDSDDQNKEASENSNKQLEAAYGLEASTQNDEDDDDDELGNKTKQGKKRKTKKKADVIVEFEQAIEIKAVALLNPAGHRLPKSMKPTWFKCGSVHVYQHKFGRSLFRKFGPAFLTVIGVPVRVDNMDNVMLSATVMRNSKCQRVSKQLEQLSQMKIPTLLVFSENDKLIEKEIFYEMTQFMKLNPKNFDIFNDDGDIELSQSVMEDWIRVMVFKAGGHYAYSNYAKTVNQAVSELLEKVRSNTASK